MIHIMGEESDFPSTMPTPVSLDEAFAKLLAICNYMKINENNYKDILSDLGVVVFNNINDIAESAPTINDNTELIHALVDIQLAGNNFVIALRENIVV